MAIKKGDKVKVHYTGTLEDGTVFDSSEKRGVPLEVEVGAGHLIPGFDNALIGMEKGEEKEITLQPKDAYGQPTDQMVREFPREQLPSDQKIEEGMILGLQAPTGQQIPAKVVKVTEKAVTIDANHPLAGKVLKFKIKIEDIMS